LDFVNESGTEQRSYWVSLLNKIASPVLTALSERRLREAMPIESKFGESDRFDRASCSHLEAFSRLLMGIAPWLESVAEHPEEEQLRAHYASLAQLSLDAATNPDSPDRMNFGSVTPGMKDHGRSQALVDTAFLAQAILRAPNRLWHELSPNVKGNLARSLAESRQIAPGESNWLLFSGAVEAALAATGNAWNRGPVEYAVTRHAEWYKGDGVYGDGPHFHWDYYNSFVIQPMLLDVLKAVETRDSDGYAIGYSEALLRSRRYCTILERLISPEATIPPVGRSLTYRMGAMQTLSQVALMDQLPAVLAPSQVRCALTAVIRRLMEAPGTFDDNGWLKIGFCGTQPALGEPYISTGSLYLCSAAFLPLGLPESHPFWSAPYQWWTSVRIYQGDDINADHAL